MTEITWAETAPPNDECTYDHTTASVPFGILRIEWKSWKDYPGYAVSFTGIEDFIGSYDTLEAAKAASEEWYATRHREQAEQETVAKIVAWLRSHGFMALDEAADKLEVGEWK